MTNLANTANFTFSVVSLMSSSNLFTTLLQFTVFCNSHVNSAFRESVIFLNFCVLWYLCVCIRAFMLVCVNEEEPFNVEQQEGVLTHRVSDSTLLPQGHESLRRLALSF